MHTSGKHIYPTEEKMVTAETVRVRSLDFHSNNLLLLNETAVRVDSYVWQPFLLCLINDFETNTIINKAGHTAKQNAGSFNQVIELSVLKIVVPSKGSRLPRTRTDK